MASEYDQKFEEMKKYIPFLEGMIARLESTSSTSNPRQAQLDKIKSLRDLLLVQKKRMKMENLLKCEQVLINLYAKVEQKDKLPGFSKQVQETRENETNKSDLDAARNKLKLIEIKENAADTLPEIARASKTEVVCTPGSKEPALFQRRPHWDPSSLRSRSPARSTNSSSKSPSKLTSRRNYTRVLLSPEPGSRRWKEERDRDKQFDIGRSPHKSPRQHSPLKHNKKERKKSYKDSRNEKNLKITLKVPENSLEALNTEDIVTRILNCSDGDVDIDTLREVRSQIIGELKDTGTQDDISELILKSYKHKKKSIKKQKGEIEDGELSDSESETIGSIYGNLKIIQKDELPASMKKSDNTTQRNLQISLVFNAENKPVEITANTDDEFALENFNDKDDKTRKADNNLNAEKVITKATENPTLGVCVETKEPDVCSSKEPEVLGDSQKKSTDSGKIEETITTNASASSGFRANFYKPLHQTEKEISCDNSEIKDKTKISDSEKDVSGSSNTIQIQNSPDKLPSKESNNINADPQNTTLNRSTVSEIDILQALKNDILSESLSIPGSETATPTLHQPKITKVVSAHETITKKRISIENYKAKSVTTSQPLFVKEPQKDTKKTSLKLTEKEFERFKLDNLSVEGSSDDDVSSPSATFNDIYSDLAPRSPDNENKIASDATTPVIIPENPLKVQASTAKNDVDMRLLPSPTNSFDDSIKINLKMDDIKNKDPRMRRDFCKPVSKESPNLHLNTEKTLKSSLPTSSFPNMTPNRTPNAISFDMTPSQQICDEKPIKNHVYAPAFSVTESSIENVTIDRQRWGDTKDDKEHLMKQSDPREMHNALHRSNHQFNRGGDLTPLHSFGRSDAPMTPSHSFGRSDAPMTPSHSFGRGDAPMTPSHPFGRGDAPMTPSHSFGRGDAPMTPSHPFGRGDAPMTPSHSFGRCDAPMTPSHSFGRGDAPMTPSHSFGRGDAPMTPSHSFGRGDAPMTPSHSFGRGDVPLTPSHSFGRGEAPMTPSHSFGRSDTPLIPNHPFDKSEKSTNSSQSFARGESSHGFGRNDPRLNRAAEYEKQYTERDRHPTDINYEAGTEYRRLAREKSIGRNERNSLYNRRRSYQSREYVASDRLSRRDYEAERLYTRDRGYEESFHNDINIEYEQRRYNDYRRQRGKSIGRPVHDDYQASKRMERAPSMGRRAPSISRAQIIGRNHNSESLNAQLPSDRFFHIDTSISRTFQTNINTKKLKHDEFDDRRRRAQSVGRTFAREESVGRFNDFDSRRQRATSVGRTLKQDKDVFHARNVSKKDYFHRACSVGRDLNTPKREKSWSEIKAHFESYKLKEPMQQKKEEKLVEKNLNNRKMIYNDSRTKTDDKTKHNKQSSTTSNIQKLSYSPRKNSRDPRVRREQDFMKNKGNKHRHGIVYSSDNIAQGNILGPGYGVKNYKIPKIKRPIEEEKPTSPLPVENTKDVTKMEKKVHPEKRVEETSKDMKHNKSAVNKILKIPTEDILSDVCSNSDTDTDGIRITRLKIKMSLNSNSPKLISSPRTRKSRKAVIESDSDEQVDETVKSHPNTSPKPNLTSSPKKQESLEASFGLDDIEIFSENMVTDPVLNNIDALIADLDNDLTNSKIDIAFNDTTVDNICNTDKNYNADAGESSLAELSAFLEEQIIKNSENTPDTITAKPATKTEDKEPVTTTDEIMNVNIKLRNTDIKSCKKNEENIKSIQVKTGHSTNYFNDLTVSTSGVVCNEMDEQILSNTTPDSTVTACKEVNVRVANEDRLPDSTNEISNDNTHLSSINEEQNKLKSSIAIPNLESIENILTILQNKDKIKQLINMLGNQDQNETIKKKLTKLSQIVESVDEDTGVERGNETKEKTNTTVETDNTALESKNSTNNRYGNVPPQDNTQSITIKNTVNEDKNESLGKEITQDLLEKQMNENKTKSLVNQIVEEKNEILEKPKNIYSNQNSTDKNRTLDTQINKNNNVSLRDLITEDKNATVEKQIIENEYKCQENEIPEDKNEQINENTNLLDMNSELEDVVTSKKNVKKTVKKKILTIKKGKSKAFINKQLKTRVTRANTKNKTEKKKTELQKLQEDLKEMFLKTDSLNNPGIRMCRLAKMVGDSKNDKKESPVRENEPVVVLYKSKIEGANENKPVVADKSMRKKPGKKPKLKGPIADNTFIVSNEPKPPSAYKPGPKSKTKRSQNLDDSDPYAFDTDSTNDTSLVTTEYKSNNSSDSEVGSNTSSSIASNEPVVQLKKKIKRKRGRSWQSGIIKPKSRKNKSVGKQLIAKNDNNTDNIDDRQRDLSILSIPDLGCFTDTTYCFHKGISRYNCRLCHYVGNDIVNHYRTNHPHSEVPLSRMHPEVAKVAIAQCEMDNFQAISKMSSYIYVCIFCNQEFRGTRNVLERFFWHITSLHTGEFKQVCSECVNMTTCPMNLDIISPPKDTDGQLIGHICEKCNYTQISLENLKHHVITRHDDQLTGVYKINLSVMTDEMIKSLSQKCELQKSMEQQLPSTSRSSRCSISLVEASDTRSDDNSDRQSTKKSQVTRRTIQSKISFENDDSSIISNRIKIEPNEKEALENQDFSSSISVSTSEIIEKRYPPLEQASSSDIVDYPHFKIHFNDSGNKEYVCCINGSDNHYKTTLLISMKKHVQLKHSEIWDGYCFICRAIVTPQGKHLFKDCFQHCLDMHIDSLPIFESVVEGTQNIIQTVTDAASNNPPIVSEDQNVSSIPTPVKSYINVRPLSDLMCSNSQNTIDIALPKIESVVSLGSPAIIETTVLPQPSPTFQFQNQVPKTPFVPSKYEEAQSEIMSKKHRVVLEAMMAPNKLARIFKCAGRFCSFTTDSADEALLHASTHARVGGENALKCSYCDFNHSDNAIDLVTHVFKTHAMCQYLCSQCFYRAGSSQLVGAHIERYHKKMVTAGSVLKSQLPAPTVTNDPSELLSRKIAVPFYICNNGNPICKFKTYTPAKFTDHLIQKHGADTAFPCSICEMVLASPIELVKHLKIHGLMRYQCTWCVFGADNESDLLFHASEKHPTKQPQGYLRIITNKEGTNDYRVLPLANLNKYKVSFTEITPSDVIENAVKEAERSIELEALIGSLITETLQTPYQPDSAAELDAPEKSDDEVTDRVFDDDLPQFATDQLATPTKSVVDEKQVSLNPAVTSAIISLDSDDETSSNTMQETSQNSTNKKVLPLVLFRCPKCRKELRNKGGFVKHVGACNVSRTKELKCLHCSSFNTTSIKVLVAHLQNEHAENEHECSICNQKFASAMAVKKHMKMTHCRHEVSVKTTSLNGFAHYIYTPIERPAKMSETFRPQDVDLLPINPIFDFEVKCSECVFSTKVRLNMVRHLQLHAQQQPAAATAPVNPVPVSGERYFDKMLNLASSSIASQRSAAAGRYPRFVPERQRRACGAPGCAYISVDDAMLRRHWDTLHAAATHYRCLHCPPTQQLDTSQPLTATRILAHLKMHDETLYACSSCAYHHFRKRVVEKHNSDAHSGAAQVLVVREEAPRETTSPPSTAPNMAVAPTMDLKPWHCGLCEFKSMHRQQVAEHCSTIHRSKMQYKCSYCPYRTSTPENVTKHQNNSHPHSAPDIFYYYYKEGSTEADSDDGTPRWVRQRQKMSVTETEVKTEVPNLNAPSKVTTPTPPSGSNSKAPALAVDLHIVKNEPRDEIFSVDLCSKFGQFCDPNGLKYKCPFCKIIMEDTREAIQSHLFEELKYRRWSCSNCSYKAFHKTGLNEHMATEHRITNIKEPVALPVNNEIETWVIRLLDYQSAIIAKNRDKLTAQRIQTLPSGSAIAPTKPKDSPSNKNPKELEQTFGPIGKAVSMHFACPKCQFTTKDVPAMKNHLESELNNIRWSCSSCSKKFVSYHEAQFHGKEHSEPARPQEVSREPGPRAAWVQLVLDTQLAQLQAQPDQTPAPAAATPDTLDNSLLAVRFEKSVPTPEEVSLARRKRSAPDDSDDEDRLLIDEGPSSPANPSTSTAQSCPHCPFRTIHWGNLRDHVLRHYKLKPNKCGYCDFTGHRKQVVVHSNATHPSSKRFIINVAVPDGPPLVLDISNKKLKTQTFDEKSEPEEKLLCLLCDKIVGESETITHTHLNEAQQFAKKNEVVVKCCRCTRLHKDLPAVQKHSTQFHPDVPVEYVYHKLTNLLREYLICGYCKNAFNALKDLLGHHHLTHKNLLLNYNNYSVAPWMLTANDSAPLKRKADDVIIPQAKRTARKSTSKLPTQAGIAKKSTTKLPQYVYGDSETEEYSYYGTKPTPLAEYESITTMMPFCNTIMQFKMKQLKGIIDIEPVVLVKDCGQDKLPKQ